MHKDCHFSTSLPTLASFGFVDNSHPNNYEVVSHCGLDLHSLMTLDVMMLSCNHIIDHL